MKNRDMVVEKLAHVGYEAMFDLKWKELHRDSIERALWIIIAGRMLNELQRLWVETKR